MDTKLRWWGGRLLDLPEYECWELLSAVHVGRVAWCQGGAPVVLPVNIVVHEEAVWFRTMADSGMARHADQGHLAIQVDDVDEFNRSGWSVLVRGQGELVTYGLGPDSLGEPEPWPEGTRSRLVRVVPTIVTGRRLLAT